VPRALAARSDIIFFVLIVGGAIAVLRATGMIDAVLGRLLRASATAPALLIMIGTACSPPARRRSACRGVHPVRAGADRAVRGDAHGRDDRDGHHDLRLRRRLRRGLDQPLHGAGGAGRRRLPPTSGWDSAWPCSCRSWRSACTTCGATREGAGRSVGQPDGNDIDDPRTRPPTEYPPLDGRRSAVLLLMTLRRWWRWSGASPQRGWYLVELGAHLAGLALFAGWSAGWAPGRHREAFAEGAAELAVTALLVGFARSIALILEDGQVLHTIVHGMPRSRWAWSGA
jgi:hypothetical protein